MRHMESVMEPHRYQITNRSDIINFFRGGRGKFTLVSKATGKRFTYSLGVPKNKQDRIPPMFVRVLTGPNNTSDYQFIGTVFDHHTYRHSLRKSMISEKAPSVLAFSWFVRNLYKGNLEGVEFWHEGRCGKCARLLTVPESIQRGLGPHCASQIGTYMGF